VKSASPRSSSFVRSPKYGLGFQSILHSRGALVKGGRERADSFLITERDSGRAADDRLGTRCPPRRRRIARSGIPGEEGAFRGEAPSGRPFALNAYGGRNRCESFDYSNDIPGRPRRQRAKVGEPVEKEPTVSLRSSRPLISVQPPPRRRGGHPPAESRRLRDVTVRRGRSARWRNRLGSARSRCLDDR
jgi:hypothetical protein